MTEARSALRDLATATDSLHRKPHLPVESACAHLAATQFPRASPDPLPNRDVLDGLRGELRQACAAGMLNALPASTLRRAPLVFWDREPQAAGFPGLLDMFLERAATRPRLLRELVEAWLRDFGSDRVRLAEAGHAAAGLLAQTQDPRLLPWHQAQQRFALFDAAKGPDRVGTALLRGPGAVEGLLSDTGMDHPLRAAGGFFRAALLCLLKALPGALQGGSAEDAWQRAAELLEMQQLSRDRQGRELLKPALRIDSLKGDVIVACLHAWLHGTAHSSAPREAVKAFLLRVIGDPRLLPAQWLGAPEEYARLMRGWLAEASLETFFALISETNDDPQWRYRRAFWRACLRKTPADRPGEVWVVLGYGMASRAKAVRDLAGGFGQMEASGNAGEQAVLLLRLGNIVMSEWSNMGPVRAWEISDRRCPSLYQARYDGKALQAPCLDFPDHPVSGKGGSHDGKGLWHRNPAGGLWQGCAAAFLCERLQLRLNFSDYMKI